MALPQAKQDKLAAYHAGFALPKSGWSAHAREGAFARLSAMGLPDRRDEYWRYTDPAALTAPQAPSAAVFDASDEAPLFGAIDALKLVFVDGVFDAAASDDLSLSGVEIDLLSRTAAVDIHWARDGYGALEARGQSPVQRPMAALNTAFATDGVFDPRKRQGQQAGILGLPA
jgi:Fe-S cluster assembly protein SufD